MHFRLKFQHNILSNFRETKKEIDLTEAHVKRHLAFAFVQFIDRQLSSNDEFNVEKLKDAKEAVKNAFNLTEDDSLKVFK